MKWIVRTTVSVEREHESQILPKLLNERKVLEPLLGRERLEKFQLMIYKTVIVDADQSEQRTISEQVDTVFRTNS